MNKTEKIWMNGKFIAWNEAKIHVLTHALHYGSGVFEGIRCYETKLGRAIFRLKDHIKRLRNSAKIYLMNIPYSNEELETVSKELVKINKLKSCYLRPIVFRGYGDMGLISTNVPVNVSIAAWFWGSYLGEEGLKNGIRVKTSSYRRIAPDALPNNAKACGQYINSILAKHEALDCKYDEAIMLDYRGFISEGSGENIFVVKNGEIFTPPFHASILPGITRDSIITIAKNEGYSVNETDITRGFLYSSDEAFLTGTAAELTPIRESDERTIGSGKPGSVTKKLQKKFFDVVKGRNSDYNEWMDYVF